MWTLAKDNVATKPKHGIHTKKFMFTVMWNRLRFHVVDKLPTGAETNSGYFTANVLSPLS
jgi:hypothetical protein